MRLANGCVVSGNDVVRTTCKLCLNGCGMIVRKTETGMELAGDPNHPLSRGFLCFKGRVALDIAHHPARIKYPLRRVGERGSQRWERVSWDEAIRDISLRLGEVMRRYGAESVCVQSLPPKDVTIWQAFAKAIGTPNFFRHDHHVCFTPQLIADVLTFGRLVTFPNLSEEEADKTRTVVLWGINPPETNPARNLAVERARRAGAKLIVIDPRPTRSAQRAHLWLRLRPGTDVALALGMLNVIVKEKLYDTAFVEDWTFGFEALAKHVEEYPPGRVAEICWLSEQDIIEAARLIASNKPTAIFTFIGLAMSGNSVNAIRCLGLLLALTGNVDQTGGNMIKIPPRTERVGLPPELLKRQLSADKFPLLCGPSAITAAAGLPSPHPADVIKAMTTGLPYPVKAFLTNSNPVSALEDSKRVAEALRKLDLLVVFELFMTPTAELADYVLPVTWFLESNAITEYAGMNFIAARARAIHPCGEAREEGEVLLEILAKLGAINELPFSNYGEYLDFRLSPLNLSFEEFARAGYVISPNLERKYERGLLRADGRPGFETPTGRVELYSTILEKFGYDPLPRYKEPSPSPYSAPALFTDYPFIMITGTRTLPFYHGLGLQIPAFRKLHPEPLLEISAAAAERLGIHEGDLVVLEVPGRNDKAYRKAHIVPGLHDHVVCAEGHWYLPEEPDYEKRVWSANVNVLTSLRDDYDPVVGGSGARCLLCRVSRS
ncbi:MAG: molybdopterin-containing oxidoreductase family protein [Moorellales bacterium]